MKKSLLVISCMFTTMVHAQQKDKKWDVNKPGGPSKEISFETTEGTWMNVDVSPDGKTIVFDLLGDIYTLPVNGGKATCLRSGLAWEVHPRYSPDGKKIAFCSDAGGADNIWVMTANGGNAKQITKENYRLLHNPIWTPDGQYLIARKHFTSTRSLGAGELWMYHISGGDGVQLTKTKKRSAGCKRTKYFA
ncbi:MAG: TolB family protein, partial [Flavobacteriales bacterium]